MSVKNVDAHMQSWRIMCDAEGCHQARSKWGSKGGPQVGICSIRRCASDANLAMKIIC